MDCTLLCQINVLVSSTWGVLAIRRSLWAKYWPITLMFYWATIGLSYKQRLTEIRAWMSNHICFLCTWVRSWKCGCLVTWFCYQMIAKPGNKTAVSLWPFVAKPMLKLGHEWLITSTTSTGLNEVFTPSSYPGKWTMGCLLLHFIYFQHG